MQRCPYCEQLGLVVTTRPIGAGIEVKGKCVICHYTCDSDFVDTEATLDFPWEMDLPLEKEEVA